MLQRIKYVTIHFTSYARAQPGPVEYTSNIHGSVFKDCVGRKRRRGEREQRCALRVSYADQGSEKVCVWFAGGGSAIPSEGLCNAEGELRESASGETERGTGRTRTQRQPQV
jgi:hypothetical protein